MTIAERVIKLDRLYLASEAADARQRLYYGDDQHHAECLRRAAYRRWRAYTKLRDTPVEECEDW